jgi:predicted Zn-dependent protease
MAQARPRRPFTTSVCIVALGLASVLASAATVFASDSAASRRIQKIVDALREDLGVSHPVTVELVETNALKASVGPVKGAPGTYRLALDRGFVSQLTEEELRAVLAHELGHVWIYTHHPYLQTEQLANKVALQVVSRESLERVYGKVWTDAADRGSLPRFPDDRPTVVPAATRPQN